MGRRMLLVLGLSLLWTSSLSLDVMLPYPPPDFSLAETDEALANFVIQRACSQPSEALLRIWRGYDPQRSEDVTFVPREPNFLGTFNVTSHSGPADYLQQVPLVLYGPGSIAAAGTQDTEVTLADVYGTMERLLQAPLERRPGGVLNEALVPGGSVPRLVVVVVWDGAGRNVLERWPAAWPNLRHLERVGTSYLNATVGSSPSITPTTHATLGTGAFPRVHRVSAIKYRRRNGAIGVAFAGLDPSTLERSTWADQVDAALNNEPKVGLIGWRGWHAAALGHGAALAGGDRDHVGIIGYESRIFGNRDYFDTPTYLHGFPGLEDRLSAADASDGERDGTWMGHPAATGHDNPGWVSYETDALIELMRREGYGADEVPDILLANYKMTDIVGHRYTMDSDEMEGVLQAQDEALGAIVDYLEENVVGYTLLVTADHGHAPSPRSLGAWPIHQRELEKDLDDHFGVSAPNSVSQVTTAVGVFLDREVTASRGIEAMEVAAFLNDYTIGDNWPGKYLPGGYEGRGGETIFQAAWPGDRLPQILGCVFGDQTPDR